VRVQVGPHTLLTDAHGRYAVWDLVPFVSMNIAVDSMSLRNPLWVPAFSLATVMVGPNMVRHVDIPVSPAAEVSGHVLLETSSGQRPVGGMRLELVNRQTGRRYEATTFSDGEFYVLGLPPGECEVSIPWAVRRALDARLLSDVRFRVTLEDGWAQAPHVEVGLVPNNS
jgi:hypothetical protein